MGSGTNVEHPTATVVGAGVFGASTALALVRRGWRVRLVEQSTPGHVGASSGGDSRLLRSSHGGDRWYTALAWRARDAWRALEEETGATVLVETGLVWFVQGEGGWEAAGERVCADLGIPVERLAPDRITDLFPAVRTDDLAYGLWEPHAGVLRARVGVRTMVDRVAALGGTVDRGVTAWPGAAATAWTDDGPARADRTVWACGPWLAPLFTDRVDLAVTRQDVCYFTVPATWQAGRVPCWVDFSRAAYGTGDLDGHGMKCSSDRQGPPFDPDRDDRVALPTSIDTARGLLGLRFPALAGAPLAGTRTCQYTTTPDTEFVIAPLDGGPAWIAGGGSGHAFKHGPALGGYIADLIDGTRAPDPRFRLGPRSAAGTLRTAGHRG